MSLPKRTASDFRAAVKHMAAHLEATEGPGRANALRGFAAALLGEAPEEREYASRTYREGRGAAKELRLNGAFAGFAPRRRAGGAR